VQLTRENNPYSSGAGQKPPVLAGRDQDLDQFRSLLTRLGAGKSDRSPIYSGLRGVGKTALLLEFESIAVNEGWPTTSVFEIGATTDFRTSMARMTHKLVRTLSKKEVLKQRVIQTLGILKAFNITTPGGFQLNIDVNALAGTADTGDLEEDIVELLLEVGELARAGGTGVVYLIDEMQNLDPVAMGALCMAFHKISQQSLPVAMVGAGLPPLPTQLREAKPYAERLYSYHQLGRLPEAAARAALILPAEREGVSYEPDAVELILEKSDGYPFFIQDYGRVVWSEAGTSPITRADVDDAAAVVQEVLDEEFFDNRVEEATAAERRYMAAIADLGDGPQRTGDISQALGFKTQSSGSRVRLDLINKGLIYSPAHGQVDFTVPHFADFMRRRYPLRDLLTADDAAEQ
jgi:hypothetical protein